MEALDEKADIDHTHVSSQITDFDESAGVQVKQAFQVLATKIRTYGE